MKTLIVATAIVLASFVAIMAEENTPICLPDTSNAPCHIVPKQQYLIVFPMHLPTVNAKGGRTEFVYASKEHGGVYFFDTMEDCEKFLWSDERLRRTVEKVQEQISKIPGAAFDGLGVRMTSPYPGVYTAEGQPAPFHVYCTHKGAMPPATYQTIE